MQLLAWLWSWKRKKKKKHMEEKLMEAKVSGLAGGTALCLHPGTVLGVAQGSRELPQKEDWVKDG